MATTETTILQDVLTRLGQIKKEGPFPDHPVAQAGTIANKAGFLLNASFDWKYNRSVDEIGQKTQLDRMKKEAIETAANCIRFLENL